MKPNEVESKINTKYSQLQAAFKNKLDERYFEEIIKKNFDINLKIDTSNLKDQDFHGNTVLHWAFDQKRIKIFNLFLKYGADILSTDDTSTVIHKAIEEGYLQGETSLNATVLPFIQSALAVHLLDKILVNPINKHGISHFHAACITNDFKIVQFFLSMNVSINKVCNYPGLAGYTPLHLAVRYGALETVRLLLKHRANVDLTDKVGMTPTKLLMHRNIELQDSINKGKTVMNESVRQKLKTNDEILCLLLKRLSETGDKDHIYSFAVCTLSDSDMAKKLLESVEDLNDRVDPNLRCWPGYTLLHFAAHCNADTLLLLLSKGANIDARSAKGHTSFDLCLARHNADLIYSIISNHSSWKNITLSDRKTKLRDVVGAMRDPNDFKKLLQNIKMNLNKLQVPNFSSLWPGSTLLHLAVCFSKHQHLALIEDCLIKGASVSVKDDNGWTPIHLAFRKQKMRTTNLLLQHHDSKDNPSDEDNLTHLHIACAMRRKDVVEKIMNGSDRSADYLEIAFKGKLFSSLVKLGATPIHVALASENHEIVEILKKHGANIDVTDSSGWTPIHRVILAKNNKALGNALLSESTLKHCSPNVIGLNYLHVASYVGHVDTVRRMLELGADINSSVSRWMPRHGIFFKFSGFTALHFAVENHCKEVAQFLLEHGADMFVRKTDQSKTLLNEILTNRSNSCYELFVATLKNNYSFQQRMRAQTGLTMLHVACHSLDYDYAKHLLDVGLDVNAQTQRTSAIWPCCTPLHVLVKDARHLPDFNRMLNLLLEYGAEVTIADADGKTALHILMESLRGNPDEQRFDCFAQLLKAHKDFNVNPTSSEGISHFHIACLINEHTLVEQFLKNGTDVNQAIDIMSPHIFAGCTPLHLSAGSAVISSVGFSNQKDTMNLLLNYGADVHAKDSCENTPLHCTATRSVFPDIHIFAELVRAGADIYAENIKKETPFECLLRMRKADVYKIEFFIKCGYRLNTFKSITKDGIIGQMIDTLSLNSMLKVISIAPDIAKVDEMGRTAIHNAVSFLRLPHYLMSTDHSAVIGKLIELGCDIDARDRSGRTALHMAVEFKNNLAVAALLKNGADVNIMDLAGKSPFKYSLEPCKRCELLDILEMRRGRVISDLARHILELRYCGLYVSPSNKYLQIEAFKSIGDVLRVHQSFINELEMAKFVKMGPFTLYDFLSESGAVAVYPSTQKLERIEINKILESFDDVTFPCIKGLLKVQQRKAMKRWQLNVNATIALRTLLHFSLPEVCCRAIFRFLGNIDLMSLIESVSEIENDSIKMCVD